MSGTALIISEVLLTMLQAYMTMAKQVGMTKEQAREHFLANYGPFMEDTAAPVEEVKED